MEVKEAIYARKAIRGMQKDKLIPRETLEELIETAGRAASWCNSQPWEVFVLSGNRLEKLKELTAKELAGMNNEMPPSRGDIHQPSKLDWQGAPRCVENMAAWGPSRVAAVSEMGISAEQYYADFYKGFAALNNAPVWVVLGVNKTLSNYSYVDLGSFGTTLMLAAKGKGIDSVPAVNPCYWCDNLRQVIDVPEDVVLVYGIGLGYADPEDYQNKPESSRMPIEKYTRFFD